MIASFARQAVTRLRGTPDTDRYGEPIIDWTNPDAREIRPVRLDPVAGSETFDAAGRRLVSRWTMSADVDADVTDTDRIRHDGTDYDIDGAVQRFTSPSGRLDHIEVMLKRVQ